MQDRDPFYALGRIVKYRLRRTRRETMESEAFSAKVKKAVAGNFDRSYRLYQAFEHKHRFFYSLALQLAERIELRQGSKVLDVGCGSGISASALDERFHCRVLGVDLSAKMVAAGKSVCRSGNVRMQVGDGERLAEVVGNERFDYVLFNASIFILPDVDRALQGAFSCLRPGGKIAFSFFPDLQDETGLDLFRLAFERLGEPLPRFRVITDYPKACSALAHRCGNIVHHCWDRALDIEFLQDFFSIPAQSASLFPGRGYEARRELVGRLFATLEDRTDSGHIVWRMAEGIKTDL